MTADPSDPSSTPRKPSRRSFLTGWLSALTDRAQMGEFGRQAGRAVREAKKP